MIKAAILKLKETVGANDLEPVADVTKSEYFKPWHIVVRKGKKYIWNKTKFLPTGFSLSDILVPKDSLILTDATAATVKSSVLASAYSLTDKLTLKGKLGAKLKHTLEIDVSGREYTYLKANFGKLTKMELNVVELNKKLESGVYVNLNNSFVDQISRNSRNCFCLVKACLTSADTCIITSTTELQAEESINGKVPVVKTDVINVDQAVNFDSKTNKRIHLPAGTALAFDLIPLAITQEGRLSLVFEDSQPSGFHISDEDMTDGLGICSPILNEDMRELLNRLHTHVLLLCKDPLGVFILSDTLNTVYDYLDIGYGQAGVAPAQLVTKEHEDHFVGKAKTAWTCILTAAGFTFEDNNVTAPTAISQQLEILAEVFDQLDFLGDSAVLALAHLTDDCVQPTSVVLEAVISSHRDGRDVEVVTGSVAPLPKAGQDLIEALGLLQPDMLQKWEHASAALHILRLLWCLESSSPVAAASAMSSTIAE